MSATPDHPTAPTLASLSAEPALRAAWQKVRANGGAPGVDGVTVRAFAENLGPRLRAMSPTLRRSHYQPTPLRAVDIPKADGSGTRRLGIATVQDRVVLQSLTHALTPLWEPGFSPSSFAYRPGRTALDAVWLAQQRIQAGHPWVVDLDILGFFDHVDHFLLMQRLARRVADARVLDLIADFLRAGFVQGGVRHHPIQGIAQGSPLSPLLANIVLDELDQEFTAHGWSFVRYADDCILLATSKAEAGALLSFTREFLADRLHLSLHPRKTRVVAPGAVSFLGFTYRLARYGRVHRRINRKALSALRATVSQLACLSHGETFTDAVARVARHFRSWANYYRFTEDGLLHRAYALVCAELRAAAWAHWGSAPERFHQLRALGVPAAQAEAAARPLDFPGATDDPPLLRRFLSEDFFASLGLVTPEEAPRPRGSGFQPDGSGSILRPVPDFLRAWEHEARTPREPSGWKPDPLRLPATSNRLSTQFPE